MPPTLAFKSRIALLARGLAEKLHSKPDRSYFSDVGSCSSSRNKRPLVTHCSEMYRPTKIKAEKHPKVISQMLLSVSRMITESGHYKCSKMRSDEAKLAVG
ncbi:hypothetical protein ACLOJK_039388 [Asimina triloba]